MNKHHQPQEIEERIYRFWEKKNLFNPDILHYKKRYTVVLPPPNVTGRLHMGHALNGVCQDVIVRQKRMQGFKTLWLPGTDHAGIATQNVVEKDLKKRGLTRFDLGKKEFIKKVWQWKKEYGNIILGQYKKMGVSCDWSRTRFTMDKEYAKRVKEAFLHYYKKGWIYQANRAVNWCPRCQTSLSDLELEHKEEKTNLWYIKYPLKESRGFITVATTRPETMLGDTAIAVNPKDERYKNIKDKKVILPLQNREIPIVQDRLIEMDFGTGAVKVTPAHDLRDEQIKNNHELKSVQIISEKGLMNEECPKKYQGLKTDQAREEVIKDLKKINLLEKVEDYVHAVPKCYRCNSTIEIIPSLQWFLKMDELAKKALEPVQKKKIKFYPNNFKKSYINWLKDVKDWCISRQIWWGHEIPIKKETDVLDTWFSSALWPFATMNEKDFKTFYPTDTLFTARDIINFWVVRMVFSGQEFTNKLPFSKVYIHPTVLTKDGQRMSKSLGTGIDPISLIDRYGADATRFGLAYQVTGGQDLKFSEETILMAKKFCNKLWNASRFVLLQCPKKNYSMTSITAKTSHDRRILKKLIETKKGVEKDLEVFSYGKASHKIYHFFWHDFCDIYIEKSKKEKNEKILIYTLFSLLKILHPFTPFITEEIYQKLPIKKKESLMIEKW